MATRKNAPPDGEPQTFEEAMARLDVIVGQLEEEKLPLEEMLQHYEEGVRLARFCGTKLEAAEQKVRLIMKQSDGSVGLETFEDSDAEA